MIMRKFHNSLAVGFFMGGIVACSQLFFLLFLLFIGYAKDQKYIGMSSKEEAFMSFFSLVQSVLLGSFAVILAAHRSEILDKPGNAVMGMLDELHGISGPQHQQQQQQQRDKNTTMDTSYDAPSMRA